MSEERDMTPVELPYTFTPSSEFPYEHYNTEKINPLPHDQFLAYNTVGSVWREDFLLTESSTEEPEEYELQHNKEITKHEMNYIIPGELNTKNPIPLYQAGPSVEELISRINPQPSSSEEKETE